jgi:pilus assembly protein CpaC
VRLNVLPEVSDLSDEGAVIIEGFRIPSLIVRRAQTTVELEDGQTFAMAGLIDRSITSRMQEIPGLGAIPILGTLFRSVRYEEDDTELLVLVTVSLVAPIDNRNRMPGPGEDHIRPNDWELYMLGKVHGDTPPKISLDQKELLDGMGLARLKGPGAWSTFEQSPVMTRPKPVTAVEDGTEGAEDAPAEQSEETDVN